MCALQPLLYLLKVLLLFDLLLSGKRLIGLLMRSEQEILVWLPRWIVAYLRFAALSC